MILAPINNSYGNKITIIWPVESKSFQMMGNEILDFTKAYLLLKPRDKKNFPALKDADIIIDFISDNLRLCIMQKTANDQGIIRRHFKSKEISIANPNVHVEAIRLITSIIDKVLPCEDFT